MNHLMGRNLIVTLAVLFTIFACVSTGKRKTKTNNKILTSEAGSIEGISTCSQPSVKTVAEMPYNHDKKSDGEFPYKYQFFERDPNAVTIIKIPGGPGLPSIQDENEIGHEPFNVLNIDPRGVGCNAGESWLTNLQQYISTEMHARDIVKVVQTLGLKNFIVYG